MRGETIIEEELRTQTHYRHFHNEKTDKHEVQEYSPDTQKYITLSACETEQQAIKNVRIILKGLGRYKKQIDQKDYNWNYFVKGIKDKGFC